MTSNVAIVVHDLMYARRLAEGRPMHAVDVHGRVYCGCGALMCIIQEQMNMIDKRDATDGLSPSLLMARKERRGIWSGFG